MSTEGFQKTLEMEKMEGGESKREAAPEISVKYPAWKSMPYVIGNETFEKLGTIGTLANLLVYLTSVFHIKSITAVTMMNVFGGTTNMAPVLGAFLSDTYLGRYATIGFASLASLLVNTFLHSPLIDRCPLEIKLSTKFSAFSISPLGLLGKKNNAEFIDRADELEKEMTQSISKQLPKDDGLLCKPKEQKEIIHFAHGLCKKCFEKGMVVLTLTAAIPAFHPPPCKGNQQQCNGPTLSQLSVLISAFFLLTIGAGGIRPCSLAFGADQFNPKTDSGRRDIASFFNWYYLTFTVAVMISSTLIIYVQSNISWTLGLAIPAVLMFFSCIAFFIGTKLYVRVKPEGSPFTSFAQVVVAAFKKRRVNLPELPEKELFDPPLHSSLVTKLPHTDQFKILDKAAAITSKDEIKSNGEGADPWRLCTLQQVEEVKCFVRIIPVWTCGIMFSITLSQQNYVVYQALQMDRRLGKSSFKIPAGSFVVFNMLALTVWIPIYDRLIVPQLRKITKRAGGITMLQRIGVGIVISILGTVVSAIIEQHRRDIALHKPTIGNTLTGEAVSSMSSLWLLPQLMLFGLSEAFTIIGQNEFYYQQFPENMRSIAGAMLFLGMSVSSYASGGLVTIVHKVTGRNGSRNWLAQDLNEGRLDMFYMMIAGAAVLNFVYFIVCANWYRVKGTANGADPEVVSERN